uniref:Putative u3 small nucleolar rna-associated protein 20 n=1 Tax=Culex tarsalis TaxID=7177 RepID=A0A1Q3EYM7_CULTA
MKNRPLKHKAINDFQFKTFAERISEVDIRRSALYYVEHENESLDENQSCFHQTIQKWSALNLTEEYQHRFQAPVRGIITLPQLLHRKEFVLEHLLQCLDGATNHSLQALLEFVVVLAKDLREDFCPYFLRFFDKLIVLLDSKDPDQLEWTLMCLAFLFKVLRGFLRKKLDLVFERVVKLLDEASPLHITNFAAECFSFITRDVKNKRELLNMITAAVKRDPSTTNGCGRLLFEIMRGVNQAFHSCAQKFWQLLLLEALLEPADEETGFDPNVLFDVLVQTVTDMLETISSAHLEPFWTTVYQAIDKLVPEEGFVSNESALDHVLQLVGIAVEHLHGRCVASTSTLVGHLVKIVHRTKSEQVLASVSKIVILLMLSKHAKLTQLDASRLSKNIMTIGSTSRTVFEQFVLGVAEYPMFEVLIWPDYLKYFEKHLDTDSLHLLTQVVMKKSPVCIHGMSLNDWKQFPVKLKTIEARNFITSRLDDETGNELSMVLILLPHLVDWERDVVIDCSLKKHVRVALSNLGSNPEDHQYFVLSLLIQCLIHLDSGITDILLEAINQLLPIIASTKKESLLNVVNLCLAKLHASKQQLLSDSLFNAVHAILRPFLASVHHETRLLVTHCFTLFNHLEQLIIPGESHNLFEVLHAIESEESTIHTYREQVMLLKRLEFNTDLFQTLPDPFRIDALRYVVALFSVNFKLLWEPACEVLQTYADEFAVGDFWTPYKEQLDDVLAIVANSGEVLSPNVAEDQPKLLYELECQFWSGSAEKVDFVNYRVKLLDALSKFNRIFEAKNRDIVSAFLNFVESEYRVKQSQSEQPVGATPKATQKILIAYLNIFAKIRNPKTVYNSKQLYTFYEELVLHRSFEVQKLALDCIFTYSNPALAPYKDNLYRLNADKTVKQEIQTFFTEDVNGLRRCIVQDEHRAEVVPLLMKIVHTKIALKVTPPELKSVLLRFVGNFREDEIKLFISMSFEYFEKLLQTNPLETYKFIAASGRSFADDIPVHRIQVLMRMIDSIRDQFGGLKDENFVQYLLHIKLCMDSLLLRMDHAAVKQLKSQALLNLVHFYDHFVSYEWTEAETETIFHVYVWPQLDRFESDCIHSPTPLLKLFMVWSKHPRYYPLLVKAKDKEAAPLVHVTKLLSGEKASDTICQEVCKMAVSMITADAEEGQGSQLLQPYFTLLLAHIERVMKRKRSINKINLQILSHVAKHAKEDGLCDTLAGMLLPMTVKKIAVPNVDAEVVLQMHTALYALMGQISRPEKYLRQLGVLLERVRDLEGRKIICRMIELSAKKSDRAATVECATYIANMNAMDRRWLDQPDFERRLNTFRAIDKSVQSGHVIDIEHTILLVHQCFYFLKTDKDLAIRDNANQCLRKIVIAAIKRYEGEADRKDDVRYLIDRVILAALMKGVKDKNDTTRNESIQLLGDLARACSTVSGVLGDLHQLTSSEDREIDFFDNITHLQIHRHRRALNRFCKVVPKLAVPPSTHTLVNFVLPIVSSYLSNEKYRKKSKLTEAAGNCVATVARLLPWPSYKALLKQNLYKMKHSLEYRKQLIKVVIGLLDNFHFDLSEVDAADICDVNEVVQVNAEKDEESENEGDDGEVTEEKKQETVAAKEITGTIVRDISSFLIPDLFSAINYTEIPDGIKLNERKDRYKREKEEMLKIPVAIAIVKLLQKLPTWLIERNLPKLMIRVINFLKSRLKQVRNVARETLRSMLQSVGPTFLPMALENLAAILKRGFQVHVLMATVHTILDALKDALTTEMVDDILQKVVSLCINDIFGMLAEERENGTVKGKTPEAKPSKKSFLVLNIMAKRMSEKSTLDLIIPFKEIIAKANSRKVVSKVEEALGKISEGMSANENISVESLLIFVHGVTSESIPTLAHGGEKDSTTSTPKDKIKLRGPDIYLIPAEPKRRGAYNQVALVTSAKTNAHVFVEMGLDILLTLIKQKQMLVDGYKSYLEPLVPMLVESLNSNHTKITVLSLKIFSSIWASKLDLSSVQQSVAKVTDNVFLLLHKYATAVVTKNDENFQLVKCSFKAVVALLKFVKYFTLSEDQLKTLLLYVEQDLHHSDRQTMTLILLRSIVARKLIAPEMPAVIKQVSTLSITNENAKIREECRQVGLEYLMNYPLGRNVEQTVQFYVSQLDYEEVGGRESAVQMLLMAIKSFPMNVLNKKATFLFLTVGIRLLNEEFSEVRALVAQCIEVLLARVPKAHRDELFSLVLEMLADRKLQHRELAAQLTIRMINVEQKAFNERLGKILPALLLSVSDVEAAGVGKFVRLQQEDATLDAGRQKLKDHALVQTLNAFIKIVETCPDLLSNEKHDNSLDELAYNLQLLLSHDHQWVRCGSLKLLLVILRSLDSELVGRILNGEEYMAARQFIYCNPNKELKSLTLDLCTQLIPAETDDETASLVTESMLLIANFLKELEVPTTTSDVTNSKSVNLPWLIRRVRYVIQSEITKTPKSSVLRQHLFHFMEALVELLDEGTVLALAPSIMSPVERELSDEDHLDPNLKEIVVRLGRQIKAKIGDERYDKIRLKVQSGLQAKRLERQRVAALEKINNPMLAKRRKFDDKKRKKLTKKRKQDAAFNGTGDTETREQNNSKTKQRPIDDQCNNKAPR